MAKQIQKRTKLEAYREAVNLREEGHSLADIGESLGVSKQYIHKLLKGGPPSSTVTSTKGSTSSVNQLTPRKRRFAKALVEGKTQRAAALEAAGSREITEHSADVWAGRTMKDETFVEAFRQMLSRAGLGEDQLARVHAENLQATKIAATATQDGKITDVLEVPDYPTRQRAVHDGWRLQERLATQESEGATFEGINLVISPESAKKFFRVFAGREPPQSIDANSESGPGGANPSRE